MWRWWTERRRAPRVAALDEHGLAWLGPDGGLVRGEPQALAAEIANASAVSLRVVACGGLPAHWVQAPPAGLAGFAELREATRAHCESMFGAPAGGWRIAAQWHAHRPFACAALPAAQAAPIDAAMQARGLQVRWQTDWGLLGAHAASRFAGDGWNAARLGDRLHLWQCAGGRVMRLTSLWLPQGCGLAQAVTTARAHLRLEALRAAPPQDGAHPPAGPQTGSTDPRLGPPAPIHWACAGPLHPAVEGLVPVVLDEAAGLPAAKRDPGGATATDGTWRVLQLARYWEARA